MKKRHVIAIGLIISSVLSGCATSGRTMEELSSNEKALVQALDGVQFKGTWEVNYYAKGPHSITFHDGAIGGLYAVEEGKDSDGARTPYSWKSNVTPIETKRGALLCFKVSSRSIDRNGDYCIEKRGDGRLELSGEYNYRGSSHGSVQAVTETPVSIGE